MEVSEERTPIDVIKNFDLTFCENWYEVSPGPSPAVFMVYPEHVKTKTGMLENHYLSLYHEKNPRLMNRLKKYIQRGFKIRIQNPKTKQVENITNQVQQIPIPSYPYPLELEKKPSNALHPPNANPLRSQWNSWLKKFSKNLVQQIQIQQMGL